MKLCVDDFSIAKWCMYESYDVHGDFEDHTGAMMSLGKGAVTSLSIKKNIQGNISTEDEHIGTYDALPQALCSKYFIESQGYTVEKNIIHQDKKSAIILEVNGKFSISKRKNYIKTRYFFIKDTIKQGDVEVVY